MRRTIIVWLIIWALQSGLAIAQWYQQPFPVKEELHRVRFINERTGWILGSTQVYKTEDGGTTWLPQVAVLGTSGEVLYAKTERIVFYSTRGDQRALCRTTDGGLTWQTVDTTRFLFNDMEFVSDSVGYLVGGYVPVPPETEYRPTVKKTLDGGSTWTDIWTGSDGEDCEGITSLGNQSLWIITYRGLVYHSGDSGATWAFQDSVGNRAPGENIPMRDIQFTSPDSGLAVGGLTGSGMIARTSDGGKTWTKMPVASSSLQEIWMLNSSQGWITGRNNVPYFIAYTADGGKTWTDQNFSPVCSGFKSMCMVDRYTGWAVGRAVLSSSGALVYKTTNGGGAFTGVEEQLQRPLDFDLQQNYPNPFNPHTTLYYSMERRGHVRLSIHNLQGQLVAVLVDGVQVPGSHRIDWRAGRIPSGIYFCRLVTASGEKWRRMLLLK